MQNISGFDLLCFRCFVLPHIFKTCWFNCFYERTLAIWYHK